MTSLGSRYGWTRRFNRGALRAASTGDTRPCSPLRAACSDLCSPPWAFLRDQPASMTPLPPSPRLGKVWFARLFPSRNPHHKDRPLPLRRLTDYHTIQNYRTADNPKPRAGDTVQSWRDYLMDARFGVLLPGEAAAATEAARHLLNPVWGVWLGRKSCPPAAPVLARAPEQEVAPGVFSTREKAWEALLRHANLSDGVETTLVPQLEDFATSRRGARLRLRHGHLERPTTEIRHGYFQRR